MRKSWNSNRTRWVSTNHVYKFLSKGVLHDKSYLVNTPNEGDANDLDQSENPELPKPSVRPSIRMSVRPSFFFLSLASPD